MTSLIDPTKPTTGSPTTGSVRENFAHAKTEIEELQAAIGIGGAGTEYEEPPGGGPDIVPEASLAHPISAGRYLIKTANGNVGSVTVHGSNEYEFSQSITNKAGANKLTFRVFKVDASGFSVQVRTIDLAAGTMTYTMDRVVRIKKVSL